MRPYWVIITLLCCWPDRALRLGASGRAVVGLDQTAQHRIAVAELRHLAALQKENLIRQHKQVGFVSDENDRRRRLQSRDGQGQGLFAAGVKVRIRLVQDQQGRAPKNRPRERQALTLTAR